MKYLSVRFVYLLEINCFYSTTTTTTTNIHREKKMRKSEGKIKKNQSEAGVTTIDDQVFTSRVGRCCSTQQIQHPTNKLLWFSHALQGDS